jgi:hypothetical protein
MMPFRKFTQFIAALVLGLVLTLSSYPAQSQEFPSFDNCFQEVNSYPRKQNLNRYSKRQVYCLFVVELIDGGVQVDKEYYTAEIFGVIMNALRDKGKDNRLTYKQITQRFPGNKLNQLINESIDEVERGISLSQSHPFQVASIKITSDSSQTSSVLAKVPNTRSRISGKNTVHQLAKNAS